MPRASSRRTAASGAWRRTLDVNRPAEHPERRFLHRLRERWVCMHGDADILRRAVELERHYHLGHQLRHVRPDEMGAKQRIGLGVGDELHEAGGLSHRSRAAVGREGELPGTILTTALLDL